MKSFRRCDRLLFFRILQHTTHTKSSLENCLIENDKALKLLLRNGEELITNICAANESRIIKRYEFEVTNNQGKL